jgi:hypothetical protein
VRNATPPGAQTPPGRERQRPAPTPAEVLSQNRQCSHKLCPTRSARLHKPDPEGTSWTKFGNASMLVYASDDIVSNHLRSDAHNWEDHVSSRWDWWGGAESGTGRCRGLML